MVNRKPRRGYALMLVLVFIGLVLSFFSLSYRHLASALRVESARVLNSQRDEGAVHALAAGLALLETGVPTSGYSCKKTIEIDGTTHSYTVTFTEEDAMNLIWQVSAAPTAPLDDAPPMPETFAPSS